MKLNIKTCTSPDAYTSPTEMNFYSYLLDGKLEYETHQFNPSGITSGNVNGSATLLNTIIYPSYTLSGQVKEQNVDVGSTGNSTQFLKYLNTYDDWGRLSKMAVQPLNSPGNDYTLAEFTYDLASGLLKEEKHFGISFTGGKCNPLATTFQYSYDFRDRLIKKTNSYWFDYNLFYDNNRAPVYQYDTSFIVTSQKNFNGNINGTEITIGTGNSNVTCNTSLFGKRTDFGYSYDGMNRLIHADASVLDVLRNFQSNTANLAERNYGDEFITYDKVGNIKSLKRGILSGQTYTDDLINYSYNYDRLQSAGPSSFSYDANGNLSVDNYQNMNVLNFGRQNLPFKLTHGGPGNQNPATIEYDYNASDVRIFKNIYHNSQILNKEYYLNDAMGNTIGIYNYLNSSNNWKWYCYAGSNRIAEIDGGKPHFFVTDHLGNTRVKYSIDMNCSGTSGAGLHFVIDNIEEYYAYGKIIREYVNSGAEKYLMNYHERDQETTYDYSLARFYHSEYGRFVSVDPLSNLYPLTNTYMYCLGNPINLVDPNGMGVNGQKPDNPNDHSCYINPNESSTSNSPAPKTSSSPSPKAGENAVPVNSDVVKAKPIDVKEIKLELASQAQGSGGYDGTIRNGWDALYELNKFNPIANLVNGVLGFATGTDSYGVPISKTYATTLLLCAIPISELSASGLNFYSSLTSKFGNTYVSVSLKQGKYMPIELGQKLNNMSPGVWSKIYEQGTLNGAKVETHYFYNSTTGQYVNPFIHHSGW